MTADALLQLAVNFANGWSLDNLGFEESDAMRKTLAEVYEEVLKANRKAQQCGSRLGP